jgi:hypothetical protein
MKKETKKVQALKLSRETLRDLNAGDLKTAAGAVTATQCSNGCTRISCLC